MTVAVACGTIPPANERFAQESEQALPVEANVPTTVPTRGASPTNPNALSANTAALNGIATWPTLGNERAGLELAIPPDWVNLSDQITIPTIGNQLGINLLFAADSERTGRNLLAGKDFRDGAYTIGLAVTPPSAGADPAAVLEALVAAAAPSAVHLTEIEMVLAANGVDGFRLDLIDGPIGLETDQPTNLYTRVILYAPDPAGDQTPIWIALLLSASPGRWAGLADTFARMAASARVFNAGSGAIVQDGRIALRGSLEGDRDQASVTLERGVRDIWRFSTTTGRFASLVLRPEVPHLDLGLALFGPDKQLVAQIDNGSAGITESIADMVLPEAGDYLIEVRDLDHTAGRYTLAIALADEPLYSAGGDIAFGEVVQGQLPPEGSHDWGFIGQNHQRISVVITPNSRSIDPVLELYGADGRRLLELDEGFSGDPELITGFELPTSGPYIARVRNFSAEAGEYTISLDEGSPEIANFYDAGDLTYGERRQESLLPREVHTWFFNGLAGDHVLGRVTPLGPHLDLGVWLLDMNLERIAAADRFSSGEPETIELTLAQDGPYLIVVQDFNGESGDYEIALGASLVARPENAGLLSYGDIVLGTVKSQAAAAWTFEAQLGDRVRIDVRPVDSGGDLILVLQGPDGRQLVEVDEGSAGQAEVVASYSIPTTGPWQLILREFLGEAVPYRLAIDLSE